MNQGDSKIVDSSHVRLVGTLFELLLVKIVSDSECLAHPDAEVALEPTVDHFAVNRHVDEHQAAGLKVASLFLNNAKFDQERHGSAGLCSDHFQPS